MVLQEKRILVEFLESGTFINIDHTGVGINMKLYRDLSQNVNSMLILAAGFGLAVLLYIEIKNKLKEEQENELEGEEG